MNAQQKKELLKALQLIKNTCNDCTCQDCPFGGAGSDCNICSRMPYNWDIKEPEQEEIWRAFN